MNKLKEILTNRWVKFVFWTVVWVLWFVVWTANPWWLLGVPVIFDLCVTRWFSRTVWSHYKAWRDGNKAIKEVMSWVEAIVWAAAVASIVHIYVFQMFKIPTSSMEKSMMIGDYLYMLSDREFISADMSTFNRTDSLLLPQTAPAYQDHIYEDQ
jgi:signal peptidase I